MKPSAVALVLGLGACADPETGRDPKTAERAPIDRFSATAGTLLRRDLRPALPGPDGWVDFDQPPFLMRGLGPAGEAVSWYDWDVRPRAPAPIYVFVRESDRRPVSDQLNVVDVIPGDPGYNDLWQVVMVAVPADYVANTVTSHDEIVAEGLVETPTAQVVNCPVIPRGSIARRRLPGDYADLHQGWYQDQIIQYFNFGERPLAVGAGGTPVSAVYAAYAINPGQPGGGPPSGWKLDDTGRSHAVVAALPSAPTYSPLRELHIYDSAAFAGVTDLASATAAPALAADGLTVNWPIVELAP